MPKPDSNPLVILHACPDLREPLRQRGMSTSSTRNLRQILSPKQPLAARAIVIGPAALKELQKTNGIEQLRNAWPMVDVVLWSPKASGPFVKEALNAGAKDVLMTASSDVCARDIVKLVKSQQLLPRAARLGEKSGEKRNSFEGMYARSAKMWDLFDMAARISTTEATVLLLGETGTGKELLARAIHKHSDRDGRFVPLDCGALEKSLMNSELFGHVKGAFTGAAKDKDGLFSHADGGTLFLDEIGNLPLAAQYHLLRALQEGAVRAVGDNEETKVDVRVIAATSNALENDVQSGRFREDLFYRLDVLRLEVPSLRERPEDVVYLFAHFARKYADEYNVNRPELRDEFLDALVKYDWPGNVRQLENFTERLILTHCDQTVGAEDFQELIPSPITDSDNSTSRTITRQPSVPVANTDTIDLSKSLEDTLNPRIAAMEKAYLEACLEKSEGKVSEAAKIAEIGRRTLTRKMKLYGIDKSSYRKPS